jgi:hypothetical protein
VVEHFLCKCEALSSNSSLTKKGRRKEGRREERIEGRKEGGREGGRDGRKKEKGRRGKKLTVNI